MWLRFNTSTPRGFPLVGQRRYCGNDGVDAANRKHWILWPLFERGNWKVRFEMDDKGLNTPSLVDASLGSSARQGWLFLLAYRIGRNFSIAINGSIVIEKEASDTANLVNLSDRFSIGGWTDPCPHSAVQFPPMGTELGDVRVYVGNLPRCDVTTTRTTTNTRSSTSTLTTQSPSTTPSATTTTPSISTTTTSSATTILSPATDVSPPSDVGAIAGAVGGSVTLLAVVALAFFLCRRRSSAPSQTEMTPAAGSSAAPQARVIYDSVAPLAQAHEYGTVPAATKHEYDAADSKFEF
jgi:hypothetical protein